MYFLLQANNLLELDGTNRFINMLNNLKVPECELKNYANKLLQRNFYRVRKENLTNELIMLYLRPKENVDKKFKLLQKDFDFDETTFPVNPLTVTLISKVFPDITTLRATLKPDTDPEHFLLAHSRSFKKLKNLYLIITDGLTLFDGPKSEISELKLYFQLTCHNDYILKNILSYFHNLKSLTICEGIFSSNTMNFLEGSRITRLSIKNPFFDNQEVDNFWKSIITLDLKILKLIITYVPGPAIHLRTMNIITRYLTELPHPNLKELSITMPSDELKIDYLAVVEKLPKLKKLRLFISTSPKYNNAKNLITFFQNVRPNLHVTLFYYKFQNRVPKIEEDRLLLKDFNNVTIVERKTPYVTYTQKLDPNQKFIVRYRKMKNQKLNKTYSSSDDEIEEKEKEDLLEYSQMPSTSHNSYELITEADNEINAVLEQMGQFGESTLMETINSPMLLELDIADIHIDNF